MREFMYGQSSLLIAATLLLGMLLAIELGHRLGRRQHPHSSEQARAHVGQVQSSLLGILALLLGFTFSLALQRHDSRSTAVVEEANAIGTAMLRADLLPATATGASLEQLQRYVDLRVQSGQLSAQPSAAQAAVRAETVALQRTLWQAATTAAANDPNPVRTGLYLQALNDMFDAYSRRIAELDRHVPELILLLLYGAFLCSGAVIGYAAGIADHRPALVSHVMVLLIVALMFVIIDLDRPRRGLIQVDQSSMLSLQQPG